MRTYGQGWVLCAAPPDDEGVEACKAYIKKYGLTKDDVVLIQTKDRTIVKVRNGREIDLTEPTTH